MVMESQSQWSVMSSVVEMFEFLGVEYETYIVPSFAPCDSLLAYLKTASRRGVGVFILALDQQKALLPFLMKKIKSPLVVVAGDCSTFALDGVTVARAALVAARYLSKRFPELAAKIAAYYSDWVVEDDELMSVNFKIA